jgi:hypothetical protein
MSSQPGSGEHAESLGVRRPVELPEPDIEAAGGLAPATDPVPEPQVAQTVESRAAAPREDAGEPRRHRADTAPQAPEEQGTAPAWETAVATPQDDGDGEGDGAPPDRPKKPVLAAVAIGGAVVLAIPLLLIGTGSHGGKKHRTVVAADTVLPGDGQQPPPGAFVSASPTVTPSPSATKKAKPKPAEHEHAAKHPAPGSAKNSFRGAAGVLLKNAASRLCADIPGYGNGTTNGPVNQFHCALGDADNQVWSLGVMQGLKGPGGAALFEIRNTKDGLCMDLPFYGAAGAGTKVSEFPCAPTKGDNQLWYRTHATGHLYRIHNYASHGLCLGVTGRSHAADVQLEIHKCAGGDDWSWPSGK